MQMVIRLSMLPIYQINANANFNPKT